MSRQREELDRLEDEHRVFLESPAGRFALSYAARHRQRPASVRLTSHEILDGPRSVDGGGKTQRLEAQRASPSDRARALIRTIGQ
jgi:hypothetical protein